MSGLVVTPVLADLYTVIGNFLVTVTGLPTAAIVQGIPNRVAMPTASPGYIAMTAVVTRRLRTNVDSWDTTIDDPTDITSEQGTEMRVQLDCYGAASNEWAVMISTLLRDDYGCVQLGGFDGSGNPLNPPICQPLGCEAPRMAPLVDSEEQYEQHWIVEAILQYNPVTTTPMQFADEGALIVINVDEAYPP